MDQITMHPLVAIVTLLGFAGVLFPVGIWVGDRLFPPPRR